MAVDRIRASTAPHPIKPTSTRCQSAWQPNPGGRPTYRRGKSVQTTGTTLFWVGTDFQYAAKVEMYANGVLVTVGMNPGDGNDTHQVWRKITADFVATAATTEIALLNGSKDSNYCGVDDVNLALLP